MKLKALHISPFFFIVIPQIFSQVIITEVMYDLDGADSPNEFVELYNTSSINTVDFSSWTISDKYSTDDLTDAGYGLQLPPLEYAVIFEGDYDIPTGIYNSIIPAGTILIKVDDNSIGNSLSTNDSLYLRDNSGTVVDSVGWTDIAPDGFSIEKVRSELPNTPDNWKASKDSLGTPGSPNSVFPLTIDGAIITANTIVNPSIIIINEKTYVSVDVANIGLATFSGSVTIKQSGTTVGSQSFSSITVLDTSTVTIETSVLSSGEVTLDITLEIVGDLDLSNNSDNTNVSVKYESRVMSINEFHAQPINAQVEFVELLHRGNTQIELENWRIADNRDGTNYRLPAVIVQPGEFVVISSDSSLYPRVPVGTHYLIPSGGLPALNNSGDDVRLFDPYDTNIDSLTFTSDWDVVSGLSTEKILPDYTSAPSTNWQSSVAVNNMTPGAPNSVIPYNIDGAIQGEIKFNPTFVKIGEVVTAIVPVYNAGIQNINGTVSATFNGNIIGSANSPALTMGQTANVNIQLSPFNSGRHKITFSYTVVNDEDLSNNTASKKLNVSYTPGLVKINEFHSDPGANQIEFVELVSFKSIVLDGWRIADKTSSSKLIPITYVESGNYIVLAGDTSMQAITNPAAHYLLPYGGLPTLNNSSDGIYLVDMTGTVIDSLTYDSKWPVTSEISTEKLRPDDFSNDPLNWSLAVAETKMTPGYQNSVYLIDHDGELISDGVYHTPDFPKSSESIQLFLPVTNHGAQSISGTVKVFENENVIGYVDFNDIARRDTLTLEISLPAMNSGMHPLQIKLDIGVDQNLDNNAAVDTILVRYNFGDVLINEFLPRPTSPQAEFVELISFENVVLNNWSIADKTNTLHHFNGGMVASDKFIVLSEDPAFATIVPPEAIFIEVANFPSLNNYGDAIYLRDFTGTVIDSLIYTTWWELATGKSTEKLHPEFISNDSTGWKVSTDSTGMTPGSPNSVIPYNIDGAIISDSIVVLPEFPESTDPILMTIPVVNYGLQPISGNIIIEENNLVLASSTFNAGGMSDTILIDLEIPPFLSGQHEVTIFLDISADENPDNNMVSRSILVSYNFEAATLNEFLADPESPLSEFIEIIALENIDLTNWSISDNRKEPKFFSTGNIESNTFIVLSEDTSLAALLPSAAIFINIENFPSLNNSGDGIFLYDFTGKIIDSLNYNSEWPLMSGKSTEKLHTDFISNDASRWKVSTDTTNTTIGRTNSISMQNVNGAILPELTVHYPEYPHPSESISFDIAVVNIGISEISGSVSVMQNEQELGTRSFTMLESEDTTFVSFNIEPLSSGHNLLEILLEVFGDMDISDNSIEHSVFVSYPFGAVLFNEFMAQPDSTQAEFVEIVSFSDIDLTGWAFSDATRTKHYFGEMFASANQPVIIASDSTFIKNLPQGISAIAPLSGLPALNNSADALFLYDITGAIIDSLHYDSEWPITNGRSTEKLRPEFESDNPARWGVAVNAKAMTPGQKNSLHIDELPEKGALVFDANPFSPNGDGIDDELLIKYKLPYEQGIIKLQIFDMTGRNIATPYWNVYFPQEGLLKWDGKRSDGSNARIGIYIIKLSVKDTASGKVWEKVKTVVLAKRL